MKACLCLGSVCVDASAQLTHHAAVVISVWRSSVAATLTIITLRHPSLSSVRRSLTRIRRPYLTVVPSLPIAFSPLSLPRDTSLAFEVVIEPSAEKSASPTQEVENGAMPLTKPRIAVSVLGTGLTIDMGVDEDTTAKDLITKVGARTQRRCSTELCASVCE